MTNKKKYKKGDKIKTLTEACIRIQERKPFYWRHKFMAAGFIEQWAVIQVSNAIKHGVLRTAEQKDSKKVLMKPALITIPRIEGEKEST